MKRRLMRLAMAALVVALGVGVVGAAATENPTPVYGYRVVNEYPHDPDAFTQGLVYLDGDLLEGTGLEGRSSLRRVDLETGEIIESIQLDSDYFGEGIAVLDDRVFQLTWRTEICFVYDLATFEEQTTHDYQTEGWGLTTDGEKLIMSDGTNRLYFRDPETFAEIGYVDVEDDGTPVERLNELELVDGEIWANVWRTDLIARIDPATGDVTGWIDLTGLLDVDELEDRPVDVLNGIAYDAENDRVFFTGKLWPTLFEIDVVAPE
jgi:glutaminyl-peptide cyclotransferase